MDTLGQTHAKPRGPLTLAKAEPEHMVETNPSHIRVRNGTPQQRISGVLRLQLQLHAGPAGNLEGR